MACWPKKLSKAVLVAALFSPALIPVAAYAQSTSDLAATRAQLEELRVEQQRLDDRIRALEAALGAPAPMTLTPQMTPAPTPVAAPSPHAPSRFHASGDLRVRYEQNFSDDNAPDRAREVVRGRLRASYDASDEITLGGEISTGDADDPNTADLSLSNFSDDFDVSLSQLYMRYHTETSELLAGRFPMPLLRTELVWDGDVNPQGVAGAVTLPVGGQTELRLSALDFVIDEAAGGPDSYMLGAQARLSTRLRGDFGLVLAGSFYDYELNSLTGADAGDFRSNRMSGGAYVSDFDLAEGVAAITYSGFGESLPLTLTVDYVRNLGAVDDEDTGFEVDIYLGRASAPRDWRFGYGYAQADVDAVFAAFSHDNTNIATNYLQHTLALDYVPMAHVLLNGTLYVYRPNDALYAGANTPTDWLARARLNLTVSF